MISRAVLLHTQPAGVERPHVEDVDALHLAQDFEALETGGLLEVGGDGAGFAAFGHEVGFRVDFCGIAVLDYILLAVSGIALGV